MASAGRILIMPKGDYNSGTTYEMLDLVNHNGKSWLAKKTSVGIEPSDANSEYWQNMFDITAETFDALSKSKGGTVFGSIVLDKDWAQLMFHDSTERTAFFEKSPETHVFTLYNYRDDGNYNAVILYPETDDIQSALVFKNSVDGTRKTYRIFGDHNIDVLNNLIDARIEAKLNTN